MVGCEVWYFVFFSSGIAKDLVVRAVEDCWNSWKTRLVVFHSFNSFHSRFLGLGGLGGRDFAVVSEPFSVPGVLEGVKRRMKQAFLFKEKPNAVSSSCPRPDLVGLYG